MKLVIVESPAKASTIKKFLGKDYEVAASYGHIRDLPSSAAEIPASVKKKPWARLAVDVENSFKPVYVVPEDSKKRVDELKKKLKKADELILATDEDREGESISWHLTEVLDPEVPVSRITFHEITKSAIREALEKPRQIDDKLVRAQESRRILDRLYGYSLSPVLWKKVRSKLSAGRVQSVALRLIVEREEERLRFVSAEHWRVTGKLREGDLAFEAALTSVGERRVASGNSDFDPDSGKLLDPEKVVALDEKAAKHIAEAAAASAWRVAEVERKEIRRRPREPFTTSTLQQAAGARLGMTTSRTMRIAQRLYEGVDLGSGEREGLITYMRTDSMHLSERALAEAKRFIVDAFGQEFHDGERRYKTKAKGAQEAHEAIRVTDVRRTPSAMKKYLDAEEMKIYDLIWRRTVSCQMADAVLDKTRVDFAVEIDGVTHTFRANGSTLKFPGYMEVWGRDGDDTILPKMKEGDSIATGAKQGTALQTADPTQHFTSPPPRYTETSLVKKLEEEGIGRPSTYAPTVSTIQSRDYVVKKGRALVPTFIGMAVIHLLRRHFPKYVDYKFTAYMEEELDLIASGEEDWIKFLEKFYRGNGDGEMGLLQKIEVRLDDIDYPAIDLGPDPKTGQPLTVRIGRNSPYILCEANGETETVTVPVDLLIDELTAQKARDLLNAKAKGQDPLGQDPETGKNVYALVGPFGPYVQLGERDEQPKPKRVGLPKGTDPQSIDLDYALQLLALPREIGTDEETGKRVTAGIGRYGPYVERSREYRSLDTVDQVFSISLEDAIKLLKQPKGKRVLKELGEHPDSGKPLQVMRGRYGPYVSDGKINATLPKDREPTEITLEEALPLLAEAAERKKTKAPRKRAAKKTTARKAGKKTAKRKASKSSSKK